MAAEAFIAKLNEQIGNEFAAHHQYLAIAIHYDQQTMQQTAQLFFDQAVEERNHALMMVRYLLDADAAVDIPGIAAPVTRFADVVAPVTLAVAQEKRVTGQINELIGIARRENDFSSDQFMQWFIKEQVEEVSKMSDLLAVARRSAHDVEQIEDYVKRERTTGVTDPTSPRIAGV
jgi:ferritin